MKLNTLHDLFVLELQDLYSMEEQIIQTLPEVMEIVSSQELKGALSTHLDETKLQLKKVEKLCQDFDIDPEGKVCVGMEGILQQGAELIDTADPSWTLDAGIIANCQRIEHYEIAGYGTAAAYAKQLGHDEALNTLLDILNEEKDSDQKLTSLAEGLINRQADKEASPMLQAL